MALSLLETEYRQVRLQQAKYTSVEPVNFSARVEVIDRPEAGFSVGGMLDPRTRQFIGPAKEPAVVWTVSEQQLRPLLFFKHEDDGEQLRPIETASRFILVGGMGSGKTEVAVRACALFQMYYRNCLFGVVGPTSNKVGTAWRKLSAILPPQWIVDVRENPRMEPPYMELVNGFKFQFLSATAPSKKKGTQIHSHDWVGALIEEEQQCSEEAVGDVDSRGRVAIDGWYPVLSTCTISDDAEWRKRLETYRKKPSHIVYEMSIMANKSLPNVKRYLSQMRERMTEREFNQRMLAKEERPERATYPKYSTDTHVRPVPVMGVPDITRHVVGADYLIGHDPGENYDVSLLLKCFDYQRERTWWVLDEFTTERTTSEEHAAQLAQWLAEKYGAHKLRTNRRGQLELDPHSPQILIRADPHATAEGKPDLTVYRYFQNYKFNIKPATYKRTTNPARAADPGQLQRNARIQCVNVLLSNAAGRTRLYLAEGEHGLPRPERLANALAMSKRDEYFRAEMQRKDVHDLSHWPSALGFALWHYEHARIGALSIAPVAQSG